MWKDNGAMLDDASYGIEALDSFLLSSFDTLILYLLHKKW